MGSQRCAACERSLPVRVYRVLVRPGPDVEGDSGPYGRKCADKIRRAYRDAGLEAQVTRDA